jgi:DNA-binding MarR family transcriptional regulator
MAIAEGLKQFADKAMRIERVLAQQRIAGSTGTVVYLLMRASNSKGVSHKDVLAEIALPKYSVSKLIDSLVKADLLTHEREESDARFKRLKTASRGFDLVRRLNIALQPPPPPATGNVVRRSPFFRY